MRLPGERYGAAVRMEAEHEHAFVVAAEGEVLVATLVRRLECGWGICVFGHGSSFPFGLHLPQYAPARAHHRDAARALGTTQNPTGLGRPRLCHRRAPKG